MVNVAPAAVLPTSNVMPGPVMPRAAIVPALVFDPRTLGNLALWLDARYPNGFGGTAPADGTALSQWNDLSGNGRHATQGTGANQPLYRSANPNLLTYNQASVETGTAGFTCYGSTFARITSAASHGAACMEVTSTAAASSELYPGGHGGSMTIPASPGQVLTFYAESKSATVTKNWYVSLVPFKADKTTSLGTNNSSFSALTTSWAAKTVTATMPDETAYVRLSVVHSFDAIGQVAQVDKMGLREGSSTTWVPPVTLPAGMPVVQFDGANDAMPFSNTILNGQPGCTIYLVGNVDGTAVSNSRPVYFDTASTGSAREGFTWANTGGVASTVVRRLDADTTTQATTPAITANAMHVLSTTFDTASGAIKIRADGGTDGTATHSNPGATFQAGNGSSRTQLADNAWQGSIAAVLVFTTAHVDTTRQRIERALGRIYGVTVA